MWRIAYKGHTIEVINTVFREKLIVDGELQEEQTGLAFSRNLHGQIKSGDGAGESVKVSITAGFWYPHCAILINDKEIMNAQ